MKTKFPILLLLALTAALLLSLCVMADEAPDSGFYRLPTEGLTVTAKTAENVEVTGTEVDVDDDDTTSAETVYPGSERLSVQLTDAEDGQYLVLLVDGKSSNLPTTSNTILYINQAAPENKIVTFDVYPNLDSLTGEDLTLYITSNADGFNTITANLKYYLAYMLGDVDQDGKVTVTDASVLLQIVAAIKTNATSRQLKAANVDKSNGVNVTDASYVLQYVAQLITTWPSAA